MSIDKIKRLLSVEYDAETGQLVTNCSLTSLDEMAALCTAIGEICASSKHFSSMLSLSVLRAITGDEELENIINSILENNIPTPDFDQILKNAKIDPNNNIKEN